MTCVYRTVACGNKVLWTWTNKTHTVFVTEWVVKPIED